MANPREKSKSIIRFILEHVDNNQNNIARITSEHFHISRQAVNKYLQRLIEDNTLIVTGKTRNKTYKLAILFEKKFYYDNISHLAEDLIWRNDIRPSLNNMPPNVLEIWHYGFTEMFNNAIDHSNGNNIIVSIKQTAMDTRMLIIDNGIGIFKKIQKALHLIDERHALFELSKGKLTTDTARHSGEGIFFTSRSFDAYDILSGSVYFSHQFGDDWVSEQSPSEGTLVYMKLSNYTQRTLKNIFDQFTTGDDYGFNKTIFSVKLAQYETELLISRSQAKRLLARIELFKTVILDFDEVLTIGQAFADEIFRVFAHQHPNIELLIINANATVTQMINRAKNR